MLLFSLDIQHGFTPILARTSAWEGTPVTAGQNESAQKFPNSFL